MELDERLREHDRAGAPWHEDFEAAIAEAFARPAEVVLGVESLDAAAARFAAARVTGADPLALWGGLGMPDVIELPR